MQGCTPRLVERGITSTGFISPQGFPLLSNSTRENPYITEDQFMKYFDVLSVCHWTEAGSQGWYFVHSVEARTKADAIRIVARKMPAWFYRQGRELQKHRICGAGELGSYDHFVGRYEGEFIDTYWRAE